MHKKNDDDDARKRAGLVVDQLLANMSGRRGFKLDQVDAAARRSWREEWIGILLGYEGLVRLHSHEDGAALDVLRAWVNKASHRSGVVEVRADERARRGTHPGAFQVSMSAASGARGSSGELKTTAYGETLAGALALAFSQRDELGK